MAKTGYNVASSEKYVLVCTLQYLTNKYIKNHQDPYMPTCYRPTAMKQSGLAGLDQPRGRTCSRTRVRPYRAHRRARIRTLLGSTEALCFLTHAAGREFGIYY